MRKYLFRTSCIGVAAGVLVLAACASSGGGGGSASGAGTTYVLRVDMHEASFTNDPISATMQKFASEASQLSGGKLQVKLYLNSQLGAPAASYQQIKAGSNIADEGLMPSSYYAPIELFNLPYLITDPAAAQKLVFGDLGKAVEADILKTSGIRVLGFTTFGWYGIAASQPISAPSDAKGLKIRNFGTPSGNDFVDALGAIPVSIDISEAYLALQQHTVNAIETIPTLMDSYKYYEVAKYVSLTRERYLFGEVSVSDKWFSSLPSGLQSDLQKAMSDAQVYGGKIYDQDYSAAISDMKSKGAVVSTPDLAPFEQATASIITKYKQQLGPQAASWISQLQGS